MKPKNYIVAAIALLVLDLLWLRLYMTGQYTRMVSSIQSKPIVLNKSAAIAAYCLMIFGLCWFVMKNIDTDDKLKEKAKKSFLYGGLFGLMVYGIYNFTAAAVFTNWSSKILVMDIIWGIIVYSVASLIGSVV